jgi:nucleotidyltransferase substrate binding protein (TIGR01987 family)
MDNSDMRWKQRYINYERALKELEAAVALAEARELSKLEQQGIIQCFEYTYELAWKTLKDFLAENGFTDLIGSRETFREAFKQGILSNGEIWMQMLKSRNLTSHIYDAETVNAIAKLIIETYFSYFQELNSKFAALAMRSDR